MSLPYRINLIDHPRWVATGYNRSFAWGLVRNKAAKELGFWRVVRYNPNLDTEPTPAVFSRKRNWCGKSRSWYAERKHSERDFSVVAAIDCLERTNLRRTMLKLSNRRMGGLLEAEIRVLDEISEALRKWLADQHRITEVRLREMPEGKMLRN